MSAAAGQVQQLQRQQRLPQQLGGARHFCSCTAELLSMLFACVTGGTCSAPGKSAERPVKSTADAGVHVILLSSNVKISETDFRDSGTARW